MLSIRRCHCVYVEGRFFWSTSVLCLLLVTSAVRSQVVLEDESALIPHSRAQGQELGLSGAAWFDYNGDNHLDLFVTNAPGQANGLFKNKGDGTFENASSEAGLTSGLGSFGAVAGDLDNDGHVDLILTTLGRNVILYHNNGDGTFEDVSEGSGLVGSLTTASAALADLDNDGFLDLYIAAIGDLDENGSRNDRSQLFRNDGDMTFTDISESAGVDTNLGACAVRMFDYDNDGWIDIFVANCWSWESATPFELFRNNQDMTFTDMAQESGLWPDGYWMGIALGDIDNDGDMDLFSTNYSGSHGWPHALYENNGDGTFTDIGEEAGVGNWEFGWGCSFADFDNDGLQDLVFGGSLPGFGGGGLGPGGGNPGRVFHNNGDRTFSVVADFGLASDFTSGIAVGDYDNNGFPDILIVKSELPGRDGNPVLKRNLGNDNHWITFRTVGTRGNRDGVGARIKVTAGDIEQVQDVHAGSSFASMDSPWLTFGLGDLDRADHIEIRWPLGLVEEFTDVQAGQMVVLTEGAGMAPAHDCNDIANGEARDRNENGVPDVCESLFIRGDSNADGAVNISDSVFLLGYLFLGGRSPGCLASANTNGDVAVDIADPIYLLGHLFLGVPPPPAPFSQCGTSDLEADEELGCEESSCP